jgi:hypothetical protein
MRDTKWSLAVGRRVAEPDGVAPCTARAALRAWLPLPCRCRGAAVTVADATGDVLIDRLAGQGKGPARKVPAM